MELFETIVCSKSVRGSGPVYVNYVYKVSFKHQNSGACYVTVLKLLSSLSFNDFIDVKSYCR